MDIAKLVQSDLDEKDRAELNTASGIWKKIQRGAHLQDWLRLLPALQNGRRIAMRYAGTNAPRSRPYAEAFGAFLDKYFKGIDKNSMSCLLWLGEENRLAILEEQLVAMGNRRHTINSPISAQKIVRQHLDRARLNEESISEDGEPRADHRQAALVAIDSKLSSIEEAVRLKGSGELDKKSKQKDIPALARIAAENAPSMEFAVAYAKAIISYAEERIASKAVKPASLQLEKALTK